jgi:hypothetical protein
MPTDHTLSSEPTASAAESDLAFAVTMLARAVLAYFVEWPIASAVARGCIAQLELMPERAPIEVIRDVLVGIATSNATKLPELSAETREEVALKLAVAWSNVQRAREAVDGVAAWPDGASLDGASLDGASLDGASLDGASLDGASLDGASLDPIRDDFFKVLAAAPHEVPGLLAALRAGKIDGSCYTGECACLVGTIAKVRGCDFDAIGGIVPDSNRPAERWFMALSPGDTPENHPVAKITEAWIDGWLKAREAAQPTEAKP